MRTFISCLVGIPFVLTFLQILWDNFSDFFIAHGVSDQKLMFIGTTIHIAVWIGIAVVTK